MKLTIITVCLNAEKTIERTIKSVLSQVSDENDIQYIIIDGVSSDNTREIINNYPQIQMISEPDDGLYDAMNKGIRNAKGEVVGILNADDWYEEGVLSKVLDVFRADTDLSVVHGDVNRWLEDGTTFKGVKKPTLNKLKQCLGMPFYHPTFFVKREVYEKLGVFNTEFKIVADYDFFLRVVNKVKFLYLPDVITNFSYGGVSSNNMMLKERIKVRTKNGQSFVFAAAVTVFMQFKKTIKLWIYK